jgi:hypothetical protein
MATFAFLLSATSALWSLYERAVSHLGGGTFLGVALQPLTTHVLAGLALRAALRRRGAPAAVSAWRVLLAQGALAWGASLLLSLIAGARPPWLGDAAALRAAALAHALLFHCPGDAFARALAGAAGAAVLPALRAAALAVSVGRQSVDLVGAMHAQQALPPLPASSLMVVGLVGGCGGAILCEFVNAPLLPAAAYARPRGAVPPAVVTAALAASAYVLLLRDPAALRLVPRAAAAAGAALDAALSAAGGGAAAGAGAAAAAAVDAAWPLPQATAVAALAAALTALAYAVPPAALAAAATAALAALPGGGGTAVVRKALLGPESKEDLWGNEAEADGEGADGGEAEMAAAAAAAPPPAPPPAARGARRRRG